MRKAILVLTTLGLTAVMGLTETSQANAAISGNASCAAAWAQFSKDYGYVPPLGQMNKYAFPGFASWVAQNKTWSGCCL